MIPPIISEHAERLREAYPDLRVSEMANANAILVEVPGVVLPSGWNQDVTTVRFLVPLAYPAAPPDCFWADQVLALAGEREPTGSNRTPIPGLSEPLRWFSWHVQQWNPNSHTVSSFFQVVLDRLRKPV